MTMNAQQKHLLRLEIRTAVGDWTHDFDKTTKISELIEAILDHFGLAAGNYQIRDVSNDETLQPDRTLVSYHLESGAALMLIPEQGSGVKHGRQSRSQPRQG